MTIDTTKIKAKLADVRTELLALRDATVKAAEKDPSQYATLQPLGRTLLALDKVNERLDQTVEKATPKVKEEKKTEAKAGPKAVAK